MIALLGIDQNIPINIREKIYLSKSRINEFENILLKFDIEFLILQTCARTEIYLAFEDNFNINDIFNLFAFKEDIKPFIYIKKNIEVVEHLFKLISGINSLIIGEEQIVHQIKEAYNKAVLSKSIKTVLKRLFEQAFSVSKEFRSKCNFNRYPLSIGSIVSNDIQKRNIKRIMILGFGEISKMCFQHLNMNSIEKICIGVRNLDNTKSFNELRSVEFFNIKDRKSFYEYVDAIISATSSPHPIIHKEDITDLKLVIYDLAFPRDVEDDIYSLKNIEVINIDDINKIDKENKNLREKVSSENSYIIEEAVSRFMMWYDFRIYREPINTFQESIKRLCEYSFYELLKKIQSENIKDNNKNQIIESIEYPVFTIYDRAIEVLKDEFKEGRGEECLNILKKIFT